MKKIAALLAGLLLFAGCSFDDPFQDDPELTSMEGLLTEQSTGDSYAGTHLLTDEDGEIAALRSLSINLSLSEYLGNKVKIIGTTDTDDEVFEVTGISVLERLSSDGGSKSFVSYKNTDLGFQLKYYDDWKVKSESDQAVFLAPEADEGENVDKVVVSQEVFNYTDGGDTKDALSAYFADGEPKYIEVGPDRLAAVESSNASGKVDYFFYRSGFIYRASFIPVGTGSDNLNVFKQMMSEFQFTGYTVGDEEEDLGSDFDESIGTIPEIDMELAGFESVPYNFTGKYPKSWYYAGVRGGGDILHHYSFSDQDEPDLNELIGLDILSGDKSDGVKTNVGGVDIWKKNGSVYVVVDGRTYKFTGAQEYQDLIVVMATEIKTKSEE